MDSGYGMRCLHLVVTEFAPIQHWALHWNLDGLKVKEKVMTLDLTAELRRAWSDISFNKITDLNNEGRIRNGVVLCR